MSLSFIGVFCFSAAARSILAMLSPFFIRGMSAIGIILIGFNSCSPFFNRV